MNKCKFVHEDKKCIQLYDMYVRIVIIINVVCNHINKITPFTSDHLDMMERSSSNN